MSEHGYILRFPVRTLGRQPITGLEVEAPIEVNGITVVLRSDPPRLIVQAFPFATVADALAFVPRVRLALWALLVRWNIAFLDNFRVEPVDPVENPVAAGKNLARSFGLADDSPIHDVVSADAIIVLPPGKVVKTLSLGEATGTILTPATLAVSTFTEGLSNADAERLTSDGRLSTAIALYGAHFYERSSKAKFLTLIMILEVMSPVTEKHPVAQRLITRWRAEISEALSGESDGDARLALGSLERELEFRRETSIRQRVRAMIREQFSGSPHAAGLESDAVKAYDDRSKLAHTGDLDPSKLDLALERAGRVVRAVLSSRLAISGS